MTSLVGQFKQFLLKQNALALAVGVIVGGAVAKVVSGIVEDIFMPIIGVIMPGGEWRSAQLHLTANNFIKYGDLLGRFIDFVIVSAVVFFVIRLILKDQLKDPPPTKVCGECLETIPAAAKRCKFCAQPVA